MLKVFYPEGREKGMIIGFEVLTISQTSKIPKRYYFGSFPDLIFDKQ